MAIGKDALIDVLRIRYDYASADTIFELARQRAQLEDKRTFDASELRAFRGALERVGDRLATVLARIDQMIDEAPAAPPPAKVEKPEKSDKVQQVAKAEKSDKVEKKSGPQSAAPPTETTVVLTGVKLGENDQVLICGALADLGEWDPERARPMSRKGDEWLTTVKLPADAKVAFKFLRRTSKGEVIWEDGDDRQLVAKPRIEATWRSA
jgi:hypothetical protein